MTKASRRGSRTRTSGKDTKPDEKTSVEQAERQREAIEEIRRRRGVSSN